jgi:hypothetical protein
MGYPTATLASWSSGEQATPEDDAYFISLFLINGMEKAHAGRSERALAHFFLPLLYKADSLLPILVQ